MLREFVLADQRDVRDLVLDGLRERWGPAFDVTRNRDLDDIARTYIEPGGEVVVVELGDEIVATGTLLPDGEGVGNILRMSVARGARRRGLGRLVVQELVSRARRRGMTEVRVFTDTPWTSAVELYRSCGFDEVGRDDTDTFFVMRL